MKTKSILLVALFFLLILFSEKTPLHSQTPTQVNLSLLKAKADTLLQQCIDFQEHVGLTAGIANQKQILWESAGGFENQAAKKEATPQMVHRIASITKPMTAVAILQLVEQGKVDLDVPIQTYLSDFPKKPEGNITTRHLLTHTSGIAHYKNFLDGFSLKQFPNLKSAVMRFQDRKLVGTPGEVYQYTTYGYNVLGRIIEEVSGQTYEAYMQENVWTPAGMKHTSVEHLHPDVANKSRLYKINDKGQLGKDLQTNLSMKVAGGGLQCTVGDLLRFGQAILNNQLISAETFAMAIKNPGVRKNGTPYGMGWFLISDKPGNRIIAHGGAQAGTNTQLYVYLDKKVVTAAISNTRNANSDKLAADLGRIATDVEKMEAAIMKPVALSDAALNRFLGKYKFGPKNVLEIKRKGDQLYSNINQFKGLKLYPASEKVIFYRSTDAHFEFELDDQGNIAKTIYIQQGQRFEPEKIK